MTGTHRTSPSRRRSADRLLDTAEGILVALRRYHINQAFFELAQTAKRHGVTVVSLADALVALAQRQSTHDCDQRAVDVARLTWGAFLDGDGRNDRHVHVPEGNA